MVRHRQHCRSPSTRIRHRPLHHFDTLTVSKNGNLYIILVSWYPIIVHSCHYIVNPIAHFAYLNYRDKAFEYCRQHYLCTLVIIDPPPIAYTPYHHWYHHIIPCVTRLFPHIHNCYLGLCISQSGHTYKKKKNKAFKQKRKSKEACKQVP